MVAYANDYERFDVPFSERRLAQSTIAVAFSTPYVSGPLQPGEIEHLFADLINEKDIVIFGKEKISHPIYWERIKAKFYPN